MKFVTDTSRKFKLPAQNLQIESFSIKNPSALNVKHKLMYNFKEFLF